MKQFIKDLNSQESLTGVKPEHHSFFTESDSDTRLVLMCHGFTASPKETMALSRHLQQVPNTAVCSVCLPGHGSYSDAMKPVTADAWFDFLLRVLKVAKENYDTVFLVGISMGGLLSIHAAIEEKVDGFISIASALKFSDWRMRWGGPMSRFSLSIGTRFWTGNN